MASRKQSTKKTTRKKTGKSKSRKKASKRKGRKKTPSRSPIQKKSDEGYGDNAELPKPQVGRRTTLTPELQSDLVKIIQIGNYYVTACRYVGVPESTFYRWLERGEKEIARIIEIEEKKGKEVRPNKRELIYVEFWEAIKRADSSSEVTAMLKVKSAFGDSWQAAMTFLERRFADRWRRKDRTEITDGDGNPVQVMIYLPDNKRD